jgi:hypothetical protein
MIGHVFDRIAGIAAFPVVALALFILVFLAMLAWVVRMKPSHVRHMSHLPLQDDRAAAERGEDGP